MCRQAGANAVFCDRLSAAAAVYLQSPRRPLDSSSQRSFMASEHMEIVPVTPVVMSFSDHDPSGGAGIQADVETLFSMGCHCSSIATALTAQDTWEHKDSFFTSPSVLIEQARAILEDMNVSAFKVGQVGCIENVQAIHSILMDYPDPPVVLDPSLTLGLAMGLEMASHDQLSGAVSSMLCPLTRVASINLQELHYLATFGDTLEASVHELIESGCGHVLVRDIQPRSTIVTNVLFDDEGEVQRTDWPRLPHSFIGSGSTLSASITAHLAHGFDVPSAVQKAQSYTWNSLKEGRRLGMGQHIPNRMFWHDS